MSRDSNNPQSLDKFYRRYMRIENRLFFKIFLFFILEQAITDLSPESYHKSQLYYTFERKCISLKILDAFIYSKYFIQTNCSSSKSQVIKFLRLRPIAWNFENLLAVSRCTEIVLAGVWRWGPCSAGPPNSWYGGVRSRHRLRKPIHLQPVIERSVGQCT